MAEIRTKKQENAMCVEINVTAGPAKGQRFVFDKPDYFLFGRASDAHVSLPNDLYVSRQHFFLQVAPPKCKLRDLDSTNGVIVNGVRYGGKVPVKGDVKQAPINEVGLKDGDEIVVGNTHFNISIKPKNGQNMGYYPRYAVSQQIDDEFPKAGPENGNEKRPEAVQKIADKDFPEQVALLVLDLVKSTQHLLSMGDQGFSELIEGFRRRFYTHSLPSDLLSLQCTGDGFLAVFRSIPAAFTVASTFLEYPIHPAIHVRMALHWGAVKTGPDGNVIGTEVQKVTQFEGLQEHDRTSTGDIEERLPATDRILVSKEALGQFAPGDRSKFKSAGIFHLEGFREYCGLWVWRVPKTINCQ